MIPNDIIQNELIVIQHHLDDMKEGLKSRDIPYVMRGVTDIEESIKRLSSMLKPRERTEIERIADTIDD